MEYAERTSHERRDVMVRRGSDGGRDRYARPSYSSGESLCVQERSEGQRREERRREVRRERRGEKSRGEESRG